MSEEAAMELEYKIVGGNILVSLAGDIDEFGVRAIRPDIDRLIERYSLKSMTLDMKRVTFVDSTGLGFLLGRYKKLRAKRAELLLKNVPPQADKVFKASGIYSFVPIVE